MCELEIIPSENLLSVQLPVMSYLLFNYGNNEMFWWVRESISGVCLLLGGAPVTQSRQHPTAQEIAGKIVNLIKTWEMLLRTVL